jgi:hypothetical protein
MVVAAGFVLRGLGDGADAPTPKAAKAVPSPPAVTALPPTPTGSDPPPLRVIPIQASSLGTPANYVTVDRLEVDAVVHVDAAGFDQFETGIVEQCVSELGRLPTCTGRFPVQFGEGGGADFQFQIPSSAAPGGCHYGRPTCTIRVTGDVSTRSGQVQAVVGAARPGRIRVQPRSGLRGGDSIAVTVADFPPNTSARALLCEPLGGYDVRSCGPGIATELSIAADGSAHTNLVLRTGSLGANGVRCGPRDPCGVLVVTTSGYVAAPAVPLQFSLGSGASYNGARLAVGLALAGVLVLAAIVLVRRTDWAKPTEAATPEVDAADLETEKSLDELFGTDEELEARDPLPF